MYKKKISVEVVDILGKVIDKNRNPLIYLESGRYNLIFANKAEYCRQVFYVPMLPRSLMLRPDGMLFRTRLWWHLLKMYCLLRLL